MIANPNVPAYRYGLGRAGHLRQGESLCPGGLPQAVPHSLFTKWQPSLTEAPLGFRPGTAVVYLGVIPRP